MKLVSVQVLDAQGNPAEDKAIQGAILDALDGIQGMDAKNGLLVGEYVYEVEGDGQRCMKDVAKEISGYACGEFDKFRPGPGEDAFANLMAWATTLEFPDAGCPVQVVNVELDDQVHVLYVLPASLDFASVLIAGGMGVKPHNEVKMLH